MIFPALKKEIHLLLIKRISLVCVVTMLLAVTATLYLEFRQLAPSLVDFAAKEARIFAPILAAPQDTGARNEPAAAGGSASEIPSLAHTSFIDLELYSPEHKLLYSRTRANGATIRDLFNKKNIILPLDETSAGTWTLSDKRIYLAASLPIADVHGEAPLGYLKGIYRLSLDDTRRIIGRMLLSCLIAAGSVLLCGILLYPGLLFFQNQLIKSSAELNRANNFLLKKLGMALAKSSGAAPGHLQRTLIYGVRLAEQQKLSRTQIRSFAQGACLQGIGSLDADPAPPVKQKNPGKKEQAMIQQKVKKEVAQLKRFRWLRSGLEIVRCDHEHYDGSGYPAGLSHDKIPITARIYAIVETFDTLSSTGPEHQGMELETALQSLEQDSGSHFDPVLLSAFVALAPKLHSAVKGLDGKGLERELGSVLQKYMKS